MVVIGWIYWDPKPEIFTLPLVHFPILWYGVFFAAGFAMGFPIFVQMITRYFHHLAKYRNVPIGELKRKAIQIADPFVVYMVLGTVVGARLGHFLFYERPYDYLTDPLQLLRVWEGGLSSHGGALGIILATILYSLRQAVRNEGLNWVRLLDFLSVPASLGGVCIRIGNFFNQEILGTPSKLPWAVIFGHPADHSLIIPRHPAQLYEAAFYLFVFLLLWRLSFFPKILLTRGKLIGLFLILVFGFRFFIEYLKLEQSHLVSVSSALTMGQILSLPAILAGFFFYFFRRT